MHSLCRPTVVKMIQSLEKDKHLTVGTYRVAVDEVTHKDKILHWELGPVYHEAQVIFMDLTWKHKNNTSKQHKPSEWERIVKRDEVEEEQKEEEETKKYSEYFNFPNCNQHFNKQKQCKTWYWGISPEPWHLLRSRTRITGHTFHQAKLTIFWIRPGTLPAKIPFFSPLRTKASSCEKRPLLPPLSSEEVLLRVQAQQTETYAVHSSVVN